MRYLRSIRVALPAPLSSKKQFQRAPPLEVWSAKFLSNRRAGHPEKVSTWRYHWVTHATLGQRMSSHPGPMIWPGSSVALRHWQKPCPVTKQYIHLGTPGSPHPSPTCWIWTGVLHPQLDGLHPELSVDWVYAEAVPHLMLQPHGVAACVTGSSADIHATDYSWKS